MNDSIKPSTKFLTAQNQCSSLGRMISNSVQIREAEFSNTAQNILTNQAQHTHR